MIRKAVHEDIDAVMRLLHQVNDLHAAGRPDIFVAGVTKYSPEEVIAVFDNPSTPVFIYADDSGNPLGYCFCVVQDHSDCHHLAPVKTLYIDDLCVDESLRGKHIGKALYEYVRSWAKDNGFYNITLNVWACNPSAVSFYGSLGLVPQKTTLETIL